jgi:hypothetical protein
MGLGYRCRIQDFFAPTFGAKLMNGLFGAESGANVGFGSTTD